MKTQFFYFLLTLFCLQSGAQNISPQQYIETYKDLAIREMKRMGVPASITLAQGLLETESGNGVLVKKSNNHFGIKCKSSWSGGSVSHDDDANGECFRKYNSAEDSYRDHSNFLRGSDRYSFLFKLDPKDYKAWAYGLKKAGYATNPAYPQMLIKSIEDYNLQQYTLIAINEVPVYDGSQYASDNESVPAVQVRNQESAFASQPEINFDISDKKMFNGVKAVYAQQGTSLLAIASMHKIDLVKLLEFNDMKEDGLLKRDSWIFLERKLNEGKADYYITEADEYVEDIAQDNALQVSSIKQFNNLEDNQLVKKGTKIYLKKQGDATARNTGEKAGGNTQQKNSTSDNKVKWHEVQPKEGLYAIARKYNVTVQELRDWNNLSTDDLKIGQKLIISK